MDEEHDPELVPHHPDLRAQRMLHAIALMFESTGARVQSARCPGYNPPRIVSGSISSHRADLIGWWGNTCFVAECIPTFRRFTPAMKNRMQLMRDFALLHHARLFIIVPDQLTGLKLQAHLDLAGIQFSRFFVVEVL